MDYCTGNISWSVTKALMFAVEEQRNSWCESVSSWGNIASVIMAAPFVRAGLLFFLFTQSPPPPWEKGKVQKSCHNIISETLQNLMRGENTENNRVIENIFFLRRGKVKLMLESPRLVGGISSHSTTARIRTCLNWQVDWPSPVR